MSEIIKINYRRLIQRLDNIRSCKIFETLVIIVIIVSALAVGAKTYNLPSWVYTSLELLDASITLFFALEITIRIVVEKRFADFFKKGWNIFDFVIVVGSLIPLEDSEMVLLGRLLRIFRVLRLVSFIPELRMIVSALLKAIPRIGYVVLLMFVIFYIYGAFGSMFFDNIDPTLWENITISMLTLFRVVTFEDWTDIMYATMEIYPFSWTYYLSFIFLTAFVFLNMMVGIVIDVFAREHEEYDREHNEGEAGEVHQIMLHVINMEQQAKQIKSMLDKHINKESKENKQSI
jgi:voltage-gated sodium channel